jgi:hypothetical protein
MTVDGCEVEITRHAVERWKERVGAWPGVDAFGELFARAEVMSIWDVRAVAKPNPRNEYMLLPGGVVAVVGFETGAVTVITVWRYERPNWVTGRTA